MPRVDYVIHYVESLQRSVAFYRDVIGLQVRIEGDGYVEFAMDNTKFALFDRSQLPTLIGRREGQPAVRRDRLPGRRRRRRSRAAAPARCRDPHRTGRPAVARTHTARRRPRRQHHRIRAEAAEA